MSASLIPMQDLLNSIHFVTPCMHNAFDSKEHFAARKDVTTWVTDPVQRWSSVGGDDIAGVNVV